MNTRKVFFGLLGVAFLAMATVSTTIITEDSVQDTTQLEKSKIGKQ